MNDKKKNKHISIETLAVHGGEERFKYADALTTPIVQSSTYIFKNSQEIEDFGHKSINRYEYGRYGNPTEDVATRRLCALENAEDGLLFSSGMSAITTTILSLVKSGDHIILTDDSYKKTLEFINSYLQRFGVESTIVPFGDYKVLESSIKENTVFIFSESPTNPYLNIFDLEKLREIASRHNVLTVIDSTFATPVNQRPLEFGVDLVIHSATKYMAGHNDIMAGIVMGRRELIDPIRGLHKSMGGVIDPHTSYLLIRGLKTFPLRVKHQNDSALKLARFLEDHKKVKTVYYPFLESHRHYPIALAQMNGGGGVLSFDIEGEMEDAKRFIDALNIFLIGPSLGGVESLITHPASISYYDYSRERRYELGITDTLFRVAVGIEEPQDLIDDIAQALG